MPFEGDAFLSGFLDYTWFYPIAAISWMILGTCLMIGTSFSVLPQIHLLIKNRSSYGLNPFTIFTVHMNQLIIIINIVALNVPDFVGLPQVVPWYLPFSRLLTIGNALMLWIFYMPIIFFTYIYFDKNVYKNRDVSKVIRDGYTTKIFAVLNPFTSLILFLLIEIFIVYKGIHNDLLTYYGKMMGTASTIIVVIQYFPQMYTTFKLKTNGSLSILMLCIQAPGGLVNSLFLWLGQHDDWSTWISYMGAAVEQFILLGMCIYYKCVNKKKVEEQPLMNNDQSYDQSYT
ncbi:hypothetical protein TVAG_327170 [Trichomonas vaginalis G3]|uniref:PQ loop repeat family protein n=1 Tax=Trichomonas vaginalis (strain ATCC PRA-98 / G3) TaxID=412133 RepID=A2FTR9_TRIV3|nr:SEVEN transmembrane protein 1-related family [Trichomonas vaginalis G3]EAX91708.1 hypothetical protein TVAG_327170 [Trichomonas vaginalis G3]KAI5548177.1 SEVEN transmembrane protein 1-related family [Trichomonas vaginalis G3]|eukprot:XP_001304638.1 hypothetical protein [Trichomonas vaginalis G3]